MQVSGTCPALSDGVSKGRKKSEPREKGYTQSALRRRPRQLKKQPATLAERRQLAHDKTGS